MSRVLFRVDANEKIGFGHLTRCLSIAQSLTDHQIIFVSTEKLSEYLGAFINKTFIFQQISNSNDFFEILDKKDLVIIDGYHFDVNYQLQIKSKGNQLICIDDLANTKIHADVVINPTPSIEATEYDSEMDTQFFIGLNYALLRPAFLSLAKKDEISKEKDSLLICFGGSDPLNITKIALEIALKSELFNEIHVVLGPGYIFSSSLAEIISDNIYVHHSLSEIEMANLLSNIEYAIVPCSGILLECLAARMKIISGYYVENQKLVYKNHLKLHSFTDAYNFSDENLTEAIKKIKNSAVSTTKIDGHSLDRIRKIVDQLIDLRNFSIRKANESDTKLTFEWANHPDTRKYSYNKELIKFENHQKWFKQKINSSECFYLILEKEGVPVGSIRFDIQQKIATISYLVEPKMHGKGYGTYLIKLGLQKLNENFSMKQIDEIYGYVLEQNMASVLTFERFGFIKQIKNDSLLFTKKFSNDV